MTLETTDARSRHAEVEASLIRAISRERLSADLEVITAAGLRLGGTPRERRAAQWVADNLAREGIQCELDEFEAFVSHADSPETFGPAAVHLLDSGERLPAKVYAFSASTHEVPASGTLLALEVGRGDEYPRLPSNEQGRIVLTDLSFALPHSEPARIAQAQGANGLIVANWSDDYGPWIHTGTAKWTWGNPTPADLNDLCAIPVVAISRRDGLRLRQLSREGPLRIAIEARCSRRWARTVQPIATIPGRSPRFVLLHGHLDAFGAGATDNGTGAVGLLELARILSEQRAHLGLSIKIAWWACHEMPYDGSTWYLDSRWDELSELCVAAVNADSWALADSHDRPVALAFSEISELVEQAARDGFGCAPLMRDFDFREAEQTFWSRGIPSAFVFSASPQFPDGAITGAWFHTEFDTVDRADQQALVQLVRTYALLAYRLSAVSPLPLRVSSLAARLRTLMDELVPAAPAALRLDAVLTAVDALIDLAARIEDLADAERRDEALLYAARTLNTVIYTASGPYGQDPVAASHLRARLPALRNAIDDIAHARAAGTASQASFTGALRERNRLMDAVRDARRTLTTVLERA